MKKLVVFLILIAFLLGGSVVNAQEIQSPEQKAIQEKIDFLVQQVQLLQKILELLQRVEALQIQLNTQLQTSVSLPIESSQPIIENPVINQPISMPLPTPPINPPTTPSPKPYVEPKVILMANGKETSYIQPIIGTEVLFSWNVSGQEPFKCKINGEQVEQNGKKKIEVNDSFMFTLKCLGSKTGTEITKSIEVRVDLQI